MKFLILCTVLLVYQQTTQGQEKPDGIFYSSLNHAIHLGQMDGVATLAELKQHGNFGLGSQHGLAAELVLLDNNAYRISTDGKATPMPDSATLPFAAAKFFNPEHTWNINRPLNLEQLHTLLDSLINTNLFSAIRISGRFSSLRYKCYYPQQKPYPPIENTPAKFFDSTSISGTMVGFFTPKPALVLNSPNYHFHFINDVRSSGGHVDACRVEQVTIEVDYADALEVKLPPASSLQKINLNKEK